MIKFIRDENQVYTPGSTNPQTFPSKSAAKRFIRAQQLPLGQTRKMRSLVRELGEKRVLQILRGE